AVWTASLRNPADGRPWPFVRHAASIRVPELGARAGPRFGIVIPGPMTPLLKRIFLRVAFALLAYAAWSPGATVAAAVATSSPAPPGSALALPELAASAEPAGPGPAQPHAPLEPLPGTTPTLAPPAPPRPAITAQ